MPDFSYNFLLNSCGNTLKCWFMKTCHFFFLYLQLSSMVWDLLQAVEHPCRLSNKTTGNHLVCTFSDSPLSDVVQVVIDMCKQGKQRGRNESTAPLNRKKKKVQYFFSTLACCLPSWAQLCCCYVDISQTKHRSKNWSYSRWFTARQIFNTYTHTHVRSQMLTTRKSLFPRLLTAIPQQREGKYATNWGDVQHVAQRGLRWKEEGGRDISRCGTAFTCHVGASSANPRREPC